MNSLENQALDLKTLSKDLACPSMPWIDGKSVTVNGVFEKSNPADFSTNQAIGYGDETTVDHAVNSSRRAFENDWGSRAPSDRREILLAAANKIRECAIELALLDSKEMGKAMSSSMGDAQVAASFIQYYAEAIDKTYGKTAPSDKGVLETQIFQPRGVVAAIIPWNFPIINAAMKAGPALATGNSVILKPSEYGTYSSIRLAEILKEAGLPNGALNVVTGGKEISQSLIAHKGVDLVTFTGSTETGASVMRTAASNGLKPVMLECGGKNSQVVFADAFNSDIGPAIAKYIAHMGMWNCGQVCVAHSRILVERPIYDKFIEAIIEACSTMKIGHPLDADTVLGPMAFSGQCQRTLAYIAEAEAEGAKLLLDGRMGVKGCYLGPTIFAEGSKSYSLWNKEIFGPVLAIEAFDDQAEAVRMANDTEYGLAATVWTHDLSRGHRLADALNVGTVSLNTRPAMPDGCWAAHAAEPAGQSGFGIEGGMEAMKSYTRLKATQFIY